MKRNRFFSAKNIAYLAVLLALVIVLQAVGGTVTIGLVSLNFTLIPIVLGAILFGPIVGGILGLACGIVVLVQVIIGAGFYAVIWAGNPAVTAITCLLKTTVAGGVAGFLYRLISKKNALVAVFVTSGIVPVINTTLFILGMLCMSKLLIDTYALSNVLVFILVDLVTFNFFIEFALNLVLAPALHRVVTVAERYIIGKKKGNKHPVSEESGEVASEEAKPEITESEQL